MNKFWWSEESQKRIYREHCIFKIILVIIVASLLMFTGYVLGRDKTMERLDKYLDIKWEIWEQVEK